LRLAIKATLIAFLSGSLAQGGTIREYTEIKVSISRAVEDQVSSFLTDLGSTGVWLEPADDSLVVIGCLSGVSDTEAVRASVLRYLDELKGLGFEVGQGRVDLRRIKEENWTEKWKKSFEPIFVTDDIVILPSREKLKFPNKTVIHIKPGVAFGTGSHATTQLCIRALGKFLKPGQRIVDVGCGSGILSIVSARLGASHALGLDIDQDAIENANENLALNKVGSVVEVRQGTVAAGIPAGSFDIAVANLHKREIVESLDKIEKLVKQAGTLIFSGILQEEEKEMRDLFTRQQLNEIEVTREKEWVCFVGKKQA
jgi:ribosomal protein L11 methyltransferase